MAKKKKTTPSASTSESGNGEIGNTVNPTKQNKDDNSCSVESEGGISEKSPVFKDPKYTHSGKTTTTGKQTRVWKSLKQICAAERLMPWGPDAVTYASLDAPPSLKPPKKYSDISGLTARYTDPVTRLRYANAQEFCTLRMLSQEQVNGYLSLRRATPTST